MLYYDTIDISEGIDVGKASASEKYNISHYWFLLDKAFKFQANVCYGCHGVLIMPINPSNIAILILRTVFYRWIANGISKSEVLNLLQNVDFSKKVEHYKIKKKNIYIYIYAKMDAKIIAFGDTEIEKQKFHNHKNPILIDDVDINKIMTSSEVLSGKKGFKYFLVTNIMKL